jgi:MFS transporter, MHS family, shikimate and dehydroshikimate transport protein
MASLVGSAIQWYGFFLYGTAAATVFNVLFFPSLAPFLGTLSSFATFAVGFAARPLGGVIFGHFGDRIGRKAMLVLTLMIAGVATFLIGLLPTYEAIGVWAPILLVTLRIFQGLGVGGQWGGAVLIAVEHAPVNQRGFYGSWPQMGVPAGLLLGTLAVSVSEGLLSEEQFFAWGWRVPFLFGIVLVGVGLFVRLRILESPAFRQARESRSEPKIPIVDLARNDRKNILLAVGMRVGDDVLFYVLSVFALTYVGRQLGLPESVALNGVLIAAAVEFFTVPLFGALSDRIGRRPVYMGGAIFLALFSFPFYWLLDTRSTPLIWLALVLAFSVSHGAMYGSQASFLSELFGTRVRYSGVSVGYHLAPVIGGGLAPLIATSLLAWANGPWPVAAYMILFACITAVSVFIATETYGRGTSDALSGERRLAAGESE